MRSIRLRELCLVVALVAIGLGWGIDHVRLRRLVAAFQRLVAQARHEAVRARHQAAAAEAALEECREG